MKIVYLGSGLFGIDCLNALTSSPHSIELIISQPPHPAGRGRKPRPTPVAKWAGQNRIELVETQNVNHPDMIERIGSAEPDLMVVIAFGQKISDRLIELPPHRAINVHSSLLPKYRGAAPINWAVINGEKTTGISIITLAQKMDAGDILAQGETQIEENETAGTLHDRLAQLAAPLLIDTIDKIAAGNATYIPQDHSKATLAPKLKKSDGFLDFDQPAIIVHRKILGFSPWPGATANYLSKNTGKITRVTITLAKLIDSPAQSELPPGTLNENLEVICSSGAIKIVKIKPAGKAEMDFADFVNGRKTAPGDIFTKIDG